MTSFTEAREIILGRVKPLGAESVDLRNLRDRVFAGELICPFDVPSFDNSQVDGYAVRSTDAAPWRITGVSSAGGATPALGNGEAVRIYTGAAIPPGADAVIMQEDVRVEGDMIWANEPVHSGQFVRYRAEEITAGSHFDLSGYLATPPLVGLAASFGVTEADAFRVPKVSIIATGDELAPLGEELGPGQIYASNPEALRAALEAVGIRSEVRLVRDDLEATRAALVAALEVSDIVISVGGVSVGDRDHIRPALATLGVEEVFWRVAIKPGKPFYFGLKGEKVVFGLPGNPVSALVTFHTLVRPALRKILGLRGPEEEFSARLGERIERTDVRYEFVRATLSSGVAVPLGPQGSHMQTGLAFAGCLMHLPEGVGVIEAGSEVWVTPLRWGLG